MNIVFRKGTNERDDDQLILQMNPTKKEETTADADDDDTLILTTTNSKANQTNDLLTQTVHQLFGKSSTKTDSTHADDQLIDLN